MRTAVLQINGFVQKVFMTCGREIVQANELIFQHSKENICLLIFGQPGVHPA